MEVEIKAKIDNSGEFEKRLNYLGARFLREVVEEDLYFNHPCRDYAQTDEALRIRNDGTLTYKGPKVDRDTKSREEINLRIGAVHEARSLLEKLGFRFVARVRKRRKYYSLGEVTICVDDVEDLGNFVEIECIGEYDPCRDRVLSLAKQLEIERFITKSYLEMLLEKEK